MEDEFNYMEDEFNDKAGYLFILLIIVGSIIGIFIYHYIQLNNFKNCYDNKFKFDYCRKYENY